MLFRTIGSKGGKAAVSTDMAVTVAAKVKQAEPALWEERVEFSVIGALPY